MSIIRQYLFALTCLSISFFVITSFVYAQGQTQRPGFGESSVQNNIGDVIGPSRGDGLPGDGGGLSSGDDTANVFLQGRLSSQIGNLSGGGEDIALSQVTSFFDGLPRALQFRFLDFLDGSEVDILEAIAEFALVQTIYENIDGITCEGQVSTAEHSAYVKNYFLANFKFNDLSDLAESPGDYFTEIATELCESVNAGPPTIDPAVLGSAPVVDNEPQENNDDFDGEVNISESDCSSNWQSQNPPPAYDNNTQNILGEIRRGAYELGMDPNQLAGVIWLESGGDKDIRNQGSTAVGLIQFMCGTGSDMGVHNFYNYQARTCTNPDGHRAAFRNMSLSQQMDHVVRYYKMRGWKGGMTDYQAYLTVHGGNPFAKPAEDGVTGSTSDTIYQQHVRSKMEKFRCGGFDWNTLQWV